MKSIKPGRGPSGMNAMGSIVGVIFGIIWTIMVISAGAPPIFVLFGVLFIIMGVVNAIYHYKNATGENRYSTYDITDSTEESDPLNTRFGSQQAYRSEPSGAAGFCPYCGRSVSVDYDFCPGCGKRLPGR